MNLGQLKEFVLKTLSENQNIINENSENWIGKAIEHPGSLRQHFGLNKKEKITSTLINKEIEKIKQKDTDPDTKGIQGLTVDDKRLLKKLNLAKVLAKKRKGN